LMMTDSFWLALVVAPLAVGLVGAVVERLCLRPLYRRGPLDQVLLTFGLIYLFEELVKWIWGGRIRAIPVPALLPTSVNALGATILIPALIVVVVGGLGSLKGSLVGSLIIGQAETFGKAWLPGASMLMIYVVMSLVVMLRPQGLFGRPLK